MPRETAAGGLTSNGTLVRKRFKTHRSWGWHGDAAGGWPAQRAGWRGSVWPSAEEGPAAREPLSQHEIFEILAAAGVCEIFRTLFGNWRGWSPWTEKAWLYQDGYHFNKVGQSQLSRRFGEWLADEIKRGGKFDVLIADSTFFTHDESCPNHGRRKEDADDMKAFFGFSWVRMACGIGFVRAGGFARMISNDIWRGDLVIERDARVLIVTGGNDLWCATDTGPLYAAEPLVSHINRVHEVLAPYTRRVLMVSIVDRNHDWMSE